jgi:hypothetical protein
MSMRIKLSLNKVKYLKRQMNDIETFVTSMQKLEKKRENNADKMSRTSQLIPIQVKELDMKIKKLFEFYRSCSPNINPNIFFDEAYRDESQKFFEYFRTKLDSIKDFIVKSKSQMETISNKNDQASLHEKLASVRAQIMEGSDEQNGGGVLGGRSNSLLSGKPGMKVKLIGSTTTSIVSGIPKLRPLSRERSSNGGGLIPKGSGRKEEKRVEEMRKRGEDENEVESDEMNESSMNVSVAWKIS